MIRDKNKSGDNKAVSAQEQVSADNLKKVLRAATPRDSSELPDQYSRNAAISVAEAEEKERHQMLSDDDLDPAVHREALNKHLAEVFDTVGVHVKPEDPEWLYIQAEIENKSSTLVSVLLVARQAASRKKTRLLSMTSNQAWDQAYKSEAQGKVS